MTERLILTVVYKNGNKHRGMVNYLRMERGKIWYTVDEQVHYSVIDQPVGIPIENIESFDLKSVPCKGWELPDEN